MREENVKKEYAYVLICISICIYIYIKLNHFAVHLKLTQHCILTIFQKKFLKINKIKIKKKK